MRSETLRIVTKSAKETKKVGEFLAQEIIKSKKTLIIGCQGELGSGKTTFIQGMAKGLEIRERITSPTFVIFKKFKLRSTPHLKYFYHIDCYRVQSKDLLDLGFKEIISQPNLVVIEWAEKIKKILPKDTFWIKFKHLDQDKRRISLRITNFLRIYERI
ncbi:MAG: tRNA (adenosine(37)-N6)-threonylcarbamoyltransferase complex ATPase subunit type 1 TsaE [Candidatus Portnoybacteria bacterium]|nr:tRNA (adenosine(37)-N6)-threonylcarbamoyltransferase complex ATPase subunit type 1 TsaE [Candidatus Portnoybacteria bacterium]